MRTIMELQKKKETAWIIKKKDNNGYFKLKYIEEEGLITGVGIGLKDLRNEIYFDMTPLEFKNFYSVLNSFKDLLYSEGFDINENNVEESAYDETSSIPIESIEDRTFKEIESLRQIEKGSLNFEDENRSEEDLKNDHETVTMISKDDFHEIKSNKDFNLNTDEIFKDLDNIEPSIEKGRTEQTLDTPLPDFSINIEEDKNSGDLDDSLTEENNKKKTLDPKEWDPW